MASNSQHLNLIATTRLTMTPQMQQAVRLLQMTQQEINTYIDSEIEQNPLLERATPNQESPPGMLTSCPDVISSNVLQSSEQDNVLPPEASYTSISSQNAVGSKSRETDDNSQDMLANIAAGSPDLRTHLLSQIRMDIINSDERKLAEFLVDCLDDSGWLPTNIDTSSFSHFSQEQVDKIIERLQRLDPPGIFARSLSECLALQLRERNRLDPAMQMLLTRLDLVARHAWSDLQKCCKVTASDLDAMISEIRSLSPRPADLFTINVAEAIVPDLFLRSCLPVGWKVELNTDSLPRVLANERYHAEIRGSLRDSKSQIWVREYWGRATWLVRALHQRATTLLKVAVEIVRHQDAFLRNGVQYLRPLTLADIAKVTELHESTISRVVRNKYIATPHGLIELRAFFTNALATIANSDETVTATAICDKIKRLIDGEQWPKILSDDKLTTLLQNDGISVARRTVAKYREAMKIPTSSQRRWQKKPVGY